MPGISGTHARTWLTSRTYKNRGASPSTLDTMRFDTKIVVVVRDDLENWQRLNVTAFLASGIAANPDLHGTERHHQEAKGDESVDVAHRKVMEGDKNVVAAARERAVRRGVPTAVFTSDMFSTGHDEANRAVVAAGRGADLDLVGVAVHGPRNAVDKIVKGATSHP